MLSNKEISQRFEVQINTLYNWQKSKPKLYRYLQNADYNSERNKEINILLDVYAKDMNGEFTLDEIKFLINTKIDFVSIKEIENFEKSLLKSEYKQIPKNSDIIFSVYDKLLKMNVIEKYILYKRIYKFRNENLLISDQLEFFFKEFLI